MEIKLKKQKLQLTKESEEYLETIYKLQKKNGIAKTSEIARQLNVALGSVTNTIENLERRGLIEHKPYKGVKLTEKGMKEALKVLRKHRLAERLLTDALKMKWSEVHEAACSLEHALTEEILRHIEKALGYPKKCPHGNPIPTDKGEIQEEKSYPLTLLKIKETAEIVKITEESSEKLRVLEEYGLKPGTKLSLIDKSFREGFIELKIGATCLKLDLETASGVWVRRENDD